MNKANKYKRNNAEMSLLSAATRVQKYIIAFVILIPIFISCAGKNNTEGKNDAEGENDTDIMLTDSNDEEYTVELLYSFYRNKINSDNEKVRNENKCLLTVGRPSHFVLRNSNGELLRFNNDEDYSELCPTLKFIHYVLHDGYFSKKYHEILDGIGVDIKKYHNYSDATWKWIEENPDRLDEANELVANFYQELLNGAILYLKGEKNLIADPGILEVIEEAYYNRHPETYSFYLNRSRYREHVYEDAYNEGNICAYYFSDREESDIVYAFSDGTSVPDGTLALI